MKSGLQKSWLNKSQDHTNFFAEPSGQPLLARLEGQHPNVKTFPVPG